MVYSPPDKKCEAEGTLRLDAKQSFSKHNMVTIVKILAGDLHEGKQKIDPKWIKSVELQTEEKLKKLAGSAGWGFAGAVVGGFLTGGIGLAVGGLAGVLSGGNKTDVCFSCELEDGRKFLAITNKKSWQNILAALFEKDQASPVQPQTISNSKPAYRDHINRQQSENIGDSTQTSNEIISNQQRCLQMAKRGNSSAITALINRSLQAKGVTVKTAIKGTCLKIILDADQLPDQEEFTEFLTRGITKLNIDSIESLEIFGRQRGENLPAWSQEILIQKTSQSSTKDNILSISRNTKVSQTGKLGENSSVRASTEYGSKSLSKQPISSPKSIRPANFQSASNDTLTWLKGNASLLLKNTWKWYVSGFKSRPDLPLYASPRLYRVLLTFFVFAWVTAPFGFYEGMETSSSSSSENSASDSRKASSKTCIENFNAVMSPIATVTLNKNSKTMNMAFTESLTKQELDKTASSFANSVFSSCSDTLIQSVSVESSGQIVTINRP